MIVKILLENVEGEYREFNIPSRMILTSKNSTLEEWDNFVDIEVIRKIKELFQYEIGIFPQFNHDPSKESSIELQMKWEDKTYTYQVIFYNSRFVMESLLVGQTWIFSRLEDNPGFALDPSFLNEKGEKYYINFRKIFSGNLLFCFKPGKELLKEIRDIIIVDDWMKLKRDNFIWEFESTFPELSYNMLVNDMIKKFGFLDEYEKLEKDNRTLIFAGNSKLKINIESSGSGFIRLSRLYPLMVASKKRELMMISSEPYDQSLHPIIGKALMMWFLENNPNPPIGKLVNVEL